MENATITILNKESGSHRTFRIKTVRKGKLQGKQIVEVLVGPDNEASYQGFGFANEAEISVWRSKQSMKPVAALIEHCLGIKKAKFSDKFEMQYSKNCCRCNRKLTTPESIAKGIGPECEKMR